MDALPSTYRTPIFIACVLAAHCIAGCTASSDEQKVRAVIDAAESAVQARDTSDVLKLVTDDYTDSQGFDKAQLQQFLRAYFLTHPKIELVVTVGAIEFETANRARVRVDIVLLGTQVRPGATTLTGDTEALQVELKRQGAEWRVTRVDRIAD